MKHDIAEQAAAFMYPRWALIGVVALFLLPTWLSAYGYYPYSPYDTYYYEDYSSGGYGYESYSYYPAYSASYYYVPNYYYYPQISYYQPASYYPAYPNPSTSYGYGGVNPYNYSIPTGDTDALGNELCYWEDYGRSSCDFNPHQWIYDPWTGTWY